MDRRATYLWTWLAVLAQVVFGAAPTRGFAEYLASDVAECCETIADGSLASCWKVAPAAPSGESCRDCRCCAASSSNRETPRPSEPSRNPSQLLAIWPATRSWITSLPGGNLEGNRSSAASRGLTRERIGFLEGRLRV